MFRKVIYNTGAQIVGKGLTASATLVITLLVGRTLGESGYGDFTKIFTFVGYFYTLSDFGLNAIYIKLAKNDLIAPLKVLLGLRITLSIAFALSAILISFLLPYNPQTQIGFSPLVKIGIIIGSLTIVTQALFTTANAYFQKIQRYDLSTICAVAGTLLLLVSVLLVTAIAGSLLPYVASYVLAGTVFVASAFLLIAKRTKLSPAPIFSTQKSKALLASAWPIGLALILNLVYFRADVFILANTRPSFEVGLYGLAYQFFEAALAIPIFFANALYPPLLELHQKNIVQFKKEVAKWLGLLTLFGLLLLGFLYFVSYFIPLIFQGRFLGSGPAVRILALGMPLFFISALLWHLLIIMGKQKYLLYIYAFGALFNVAANIVLIPTYGYLAAATITVVSEALILLLLTIALKLSWK